MGLPPSLSVCTRSCLAPRPILPLSDTMTSPTSLHTLYKRCEVHQTCSIPVKNTTCACSLWEEDISLYLLAPFSFPPSPQIIVSLSLQALPLCIASIRNMHNQCPREVLTFLIDLFKFSDNQTNKVRSPQLPFN